MAYIGKSIESGTFSVLDTSGNTYNGSNVTFSLGTQVGSPAQLLVSHDGVIQKPGTDYSLASGGTQITFSTAPASGASIFIVEISGAVGGPLDSDLNGTELILDADGDTSITADTDDQIDIKIAGADDFKFSANAMNVLSGSTLTIDSGATITNSGTANGFGALAGIDDQSSSNDDQLTITDTAVVINEDSDDVDFRVESNGNANMLFVSGGNDVVGISNEGDLGTGLHIKIADTGASVNSAADELVIEGTSTVGMSFLTNNDQDSNITFGDSDANERGRIQYSHGSDFMAFHTNADEAMRINSNHSFNFNYGNNNNAAVTMYVSGQLNNTAMAVRHGTSSSTDEILIAFTDGADQACGQIRVNPNANTVSYGTSSDYRLKENVNYNFDATTELKKLKPAKFNWKTNSSLTIEGFLAHEVADVVPLAVQGAKDETEVIPNGVYNANGNLQRKDVSEDEWTKGKTNGVFASDTTWSASKTIPKYQIIDQAKLVPLLVKTVQELEARIATLEG